MLTGTRTAPTREQVWAELESASFAVLAHVTPAGQPRTSGIVYKTIAGRLYIAVAPDSWKARHIHTGDQVALTVPVHRGGPLALLLPIPPATISFAATAVVHEPGSVRVHALLSSLDGLLPADHIASTCLIEATPRDHFVTYGIGVSVLRMRDPARSRARVPAT